MPKVQTLCQSYFSCFVSFNTTMPSGIVSSIQDVEVWYINAKFSNANNSAGFFMSLPCEIHQKNKFNVGNVRSSAL